MAEIWDILDHLDRNPGDHEERWKLAKKFYAAWEYEQALEHLELLKREWEPKLNVSRYLAATYYRLGKNEEALEELRDALDRWPDELSLKEQMTRVLETLKDYAGARTVWQEIRDAQPDHPLAEKALERLKRSERKAAERTKRNKPPKALAFAGATKVCPVCGASNLDDATECWQCGEGGRGVKTPVPRAAEAAHAKSVALSPETATVAVVAMVGLLLLAGGYGTVLMLRDAGAAVEDPRPVATLADVWARQMPASRIFSGIAVIFLWPLILRLALRLVRQPRPAPPVVVNLSAVFLGSLGYALTFLPHPANVLALLLPALASLVLTLTLFGLAPAKAVAAWGIQYLLVFITGALLFFASESFQLGMPVNPLRELRNVARHIGDTGQHRDPGMYQMPDEAMPWERRVVWRETGSAWLDRRAGPVAFVVVPEAEVSEIKFQIYDDSGVRVFDYVKERPYTRFFEVEPGREYRIVVEGPGNRAARVIIQSLLIPEFL